ncbi:MAG: hypothetical protein Q8S01_06750, partial [Ignavibacteria bacterium]|nr:hypothetical protein [Ignavibacteria bacterium]
VNRGHFATDKLQQMHENAIEEQTRLKLQRQAEETQQSLQDYVLIKEMERDKLLQQKEIKGLEHEQQLAEAEHTQRLMLERKTHEEKLQFQKDEIQSELEKIRAMNEQQLAFLESLKSMNVDMTSYLVSQFQRPDHVYEFVNKSSSTSAADSTSSTSYLPQIHLYKP